MSKTQATETKVTQADVDAVIAEIRNEGTPFCQPFADMLLLATNLDTPLSWFQEKAQSLNREVRLYIAWSPATPESVLDVLAQDEDEDIRENALDRTYRWVN